MSRPLILVLGLSLAACSGGADNSGDNAERLLNASFENTPSEAPAGFTLPSGVLGHKHLVAWAKLVRDYKKPDQFSKDWLGLEIVGRQFRIKNQLSADYGNGFFAHWSYDADKEVMTVSIETTGNPLYPLSTDVKELGSAKMSNAFGAEREVKQSRMWSIGIGNGGDALKPLEAPVADRDYPYIGLSHSIQMKPEAARAFANDLSSRWREPSPRTPMVEQLSARPAQRHQRSRSLKASSRMIAR